MTILEFAQKYGVTKNKAKCHIKKLSSEDKYKDEKGIIHLTEQGEEKLKELVATSCKTTEEPPKTTDKTTEMAREIELLQEQIGILQEQNQALQKDKEFLQNQLQQASNRADYLTIQNMSFFKRRKALKEYNQRLAIAERGDKE